MKVIKSRGVTSLFVVLLSVFHAFIFIFTSNHPEFHRLLSEKNTLQGFWRKWSAFIAGGNMKYIGYLLLFFSLVIIVLYFVKRNAANERMKSQNVLMIGGGLSLLLYPILLMLVLSDSNYAIESVFLMGTIQCVVTLAVVLFDIIRA